LARSKSASKPGRRSFIGGALAGLALPALARAAALSESGLDFLAIGDWGERGSRGQRRVASAMAGAARRSAPKFVLALGDNFYPTGVASADDPHWRVSFDAVYTDPALGCPWYAVVGNHDHEGDIKAQIERSRTDARWRMPARFYTMTQAVPDGGIAEFFCLDTTSIINPVTSPPDSDDQLGWLDRALAESRADWKIAVGHHPVFSGGAHGNTLELVDTLKPIFERHRVAAYLNGHDHDLQHIVAGGIHYVTCGAGSQTRKTRKIDGTLYAASKLGFMAASLNSSALAFEFVGAAGTTLYRSEIPARG